MPQDVSQKQRLLYSKALEYRKEEAWSDALNTLEQCLELGPYAPASSLKESIEDILDFFCKDWLNP